MQRNIKDIYEVIELLKNGNILTSASQNQIIMKNKKIRIHSDSMNIVIDVDNFKELYKNTTFFIYDDESGIDNNKDEDYYRYYKK